MTKMKRFFAGCLMGLALAGAIVGMTPAACAAENAQTMIVERDTAYYGDRKITSDYQITRGTVTLGESTLTVAGDFYLDGGELRVCGGTLNVLGDLYVSSNLTFVSGKINVSGDLIHKSGKLHVGSGDLYVADDYLMAVPKTNEAGETVLNSGSGKLTMQYSNADIVVGGDFYMDTVHGVECANGTITVAGDFVQKADFAPRKFVASRYHKVVLNGTEPQTVKLESRESTFGYLVVDNTAGIVVTDYLAAHYLQSTGEELTIVSEEGKADFENVTVDAPLVTVIGDVELHGDLKLQRYTLKVEGDLTHTDGVLMTDWGTLDITGSYYLACPEGFDEVGEPIWKGSHGELVMNNSKSHMNVGGDFYMDASEGVSLTAGTLSVAGDFTQSVNYSLKKFTASQNHKVVFNGTEVQTVTLQSPESIFAVAEVANNAGILVTDCFGAASLTAPNGEVKILSEGAVFENLTLDAPLVTVTGDLIQDGALNLKNSTLKVEGDLILNNGEIQVSKGSLQVTGEQKVASELGEIDNSAEVPVAFKEPLDEVTEVEVVPVLSILNNNVKSTTYILNSNTKKFHYTGCNDVDEIKASNRSSFTGTRAEVIAKGYSPCGHCDP